MRRDSGATPPLLVGCSGSGRLRRRSRPCSGSHAPAFIRAAAASFCAPLTVVHLILRTFFATCVADFSARIADCGGELATTRHIARGQAANLGTVHIEADAACHRLYVLLGQASAGTMVALGRAGITFIDTGLKLFMGHRDLLCWGSENLTVPREGRGQIHTHAKSVPCLLYSSQARMPASSGRLFIARGIPICARITSKTSTAR
jgi:hypothetical protein